MQEDSEQTLSTWGAGDHSSTASRQGAVVLKNAGPWSPSVVGLLRHLERVGFEGAPRVVGDGFHADGRMTLEYAEGTSAHPQAWPDGRHARVGELLRRAHRATASYDAPSTATWQRSVLSGIGGDDLVLGHGDAAPWNIVGPGGEPQTLIDWDLAGPVDRLTEVAYAVWLNAQLHDDDVAELQQLPPAAERVGHAIAVTDGYEVASREREVLVERMIEVALASAREHAVDAAVGPDCTEAVTADGFPTLWSIAWRSRSAHWMYVHRHALSGPVQL